MALRDGISEETLSKIITVCNKLEEPKQTEPNRGPKRKAQRTQSSESKKRGHSNSNSKSSERIKNNKDVMDSWKERASDIDIEHERQNVIKEFGFVEFGVLEFCVV